MPFPKADHDLPIGTGATGTRAETDAMGEIDVPAEHYWGAQTQRALQHFAIGDDRMPVALYRAYGIVKQAAALVNAEAGRLDPNLAAAIVHACEEVAEGSLDDEFPLYVWQSGSGTQSNMNVNEVVANRASQLLAGGLGRDRIVHPNDHVNLAQSTNDTFPTAMHVATLLEVRDGTLPQVLALAAAIGDRARRWADVVKIGRTHLQDATPLTVGQEWSGWEAQLRDAASRLEQSLDAICELAAGGTAVGTGINAPDGFGEAVAAKLAELTGLPLVTARNKFAAQGSLDGMVAVSAALRGVAVALMKAANDMRWLSSARARACTSCACPRTSRAPRSCPGR
nr:hypothetical protein GCM10025732_50350 [Glycomyces mayteni]